MKGEKEIDLPNATVDGYILLFEALSKLKLMIVHQCRVGDNDQWCADT